MSIARGVTCFTQGLKLATTAKVRPYIIAPAIVSLLIIGTGLYFGFAYINEFSNYLNASLPSWLSFVEAIIAPILYLIGILASTWLFGLVATVVGSPFLGELAMAIENPTREPSPWWKQIGAALSREWRKLRYHLPRIAGLLLLGLVPLVNAVAPLLWLGLWRLDDGRTIL